MVLLFYGRERVHGEEELGRRSYLVDQLCSRFQQAVLNNAVYTLEEPPEPGQLESEFCLPFPQDQVQNTKKFNIV